MEFYKLPDKECKIVIQKNPNDRQEKKQITKWIQKNNEQEWEVKRKKKEPNRNPSAEYKNINQKQDIELNHRHKQKKEVANWKIGHFDLANERNYNNNNNNKDSPGEHIYIMGI